MTHTPVKRRAAGVRQAEIIGVAAAAIAQKGFRGVSLADIAAKVGVSQPGLLHHFPSKERLLIAVLEHRDREDELFVARLFADPANGVVDAMLALCRHNMANPDIVRLYTVTAAESIDPTHPAHEFFQQRYLTVRSRMAVHVREDQAAGRLAPDLDPDEVAVEIIAMMDGLQIQWLLDPSTDMCAVLGQHLQRYARTA